MEKHPTAIDRLLRRPEVEALTGLARIIHAWRPI